jgi:hypothetical protein
MKMSAKIFVKELSGISLPNVFNPYSDCCAMFDLPKAATVRRKNLISYLAAIERSGTDVIWMGRDLGYRGGRRTGLALTDESHLSDMEQCYPGSEVNKATTGPVVAERTATEIWAAIRSVPLPPLLWNVFPFHPHERDQPLTNRKFMARELVVVDELNRMLISWLGISTIVGIGQDAAKYAADFGIAVECIRHPSYGGTKDFRTGVERLYGVELRRSGIGQSELFA